MSTKKQHPQSGSMSMSVSSSDITALSCVFGEVLARNAGGACIEGGRHMTSAAYALEAAGLSAGSCGLSAADVLFLSGSSSESMPSRRSRSLMDKLFGKGGWLIPDFRRVAKAATLAVALQNALVPQVVWAAGPFTETVSGTTIVSGEVVTSDGGDEEGSIQTVLSGGSAVDGTVVSGGSQIIQNLGEAIRMLLDNGGLQFVSSGGLATSTTVSGGGSQTVFTGGSAVSAILDGGWQAIIGGLATGTTVNSGGQQHISTGGSAAGTVVNNSGQQIISAGGVATGTTISSGGSQTVSTGGTASGTVIASDGRQTVSTGGSAVSTTLNGGWQAVLGGVASGTTVNNDGTQTISNGGLAVNTIISSGGNQIVENGSASSTTVNSGGQQVVSSGGVVTGTLVNSFGTQDISSGGVASSTTLIGTGRQSVFSGGLATGTTVSSGGQQIVFNDGAAAGTTVSAGGSQVASSGGAVTGTTVGSGGVQHVSSGGSAAGTTISTGGTQHISANGLVSDTTILTGGVQHVSANGSVTGTTISAGGVQRISSGGLVSDTTVSTGGQQHVSAGGSATSTVVSTGGNLYVSAGGQATAIDQQTGGNVNANVVGGDTSTVATGSNASGAFSLLNGVATDFILYTGGYQHVSAGGVATGTTVSNGGVQHVSSGGRATSATVNNGGVQHVSAGGSATSTVVNTGGNMYVSSGGQATAIDQQVGGNVHVSVVGGDSSTVATGSNVSGAFSLEDGVATNFILYAGGRQYVSSGGLTTSATVSSGGILYVSSGGSAMEVDQQVGGNVNVSAIGGDTETVVSGTNAYGNVFSLLNGVAKDFVLYLNGRQDVLAGGSATDTAISSGGSQVVSTGGLASATTVTSGGSQVVLTGGQAEKTHLSGGVAVNTSAVQLLQGGSATSTTIDNGGRQFVSAGGLATSTTVTSGGIQNVSSGGSAENTTLISGGVQNITVSGKATSTTLSELGTQNVSTGGSATSTTINSGGLQNILAGGAASDTSIYNSGTQTVVGAGATATSTTISSGGSQVTSLGGTASVTTVSSGGSQVVGLSGWVNSTTVSAGGQQDVQAGGSATSATLSSGGRQDVSSGGTASATTVSTGGLQMVSAGGSARGATVEGLPGADNSGVQILEGGWASGTILNADGHQIVSAGGLALATTINDGGWQHVSTGGSASGATISTGGVQQVSTGGVVTGTTISSGGTQNVSTGGLATVTTIRGDGVQHVSAGGSASATTIETGGLQHVSGGGSATNTTINGGTQQVDATGLATSTTVNSGGSQIVSSGGTAVSTTVNSAGTLEISPDATMGGTNLVRDGGILDATVLFLGDAATNITFEHNTDATRDVLITGTGGLTKTGTGVLTLTAAHTYSGGTTVSDGTLAGNTTSLQGNIAIASGANVRFDQTDDGTYAGVMSGLGSMTKTGAGALTLTGANNYRGGTTVSDGTLIGHTTSLQGNILNNAAVVFNQASDGTYSGAMSGMGTLTKNGAETLTLSGTNTYTGDTFVNAGGLTVTGTLGGVKAGVYTGNIFLGSDVELRFNQSDLQTLSGVLSGDTTTHIVKTGTGTLTLSGNNSDFDGTTSLLGGGIHLAGTLGGTYSQTGAGTEFTSDHGATLLGHATFSAGEVTPTGTLNMTSGTFNGAVINLSVGDSPSILATGTLDLTGAILNISSFQYDFEPETWEAADPKTLIQAGLLTSTFGDIAGVSVASLSGPVDFLGAYVYQVDSSIQILAGLAWYARNNTAHGTFTIADGGYFTLGVALHDEPDNPVLSWDGKTLTKKGAGTLILTGANTYTGNTVIQSGTIGIQDASNIGGVGLSHLQFDSPNTATGADVATLHVVDGAAVVFTGTEARNQRIHVAANKSGQIDLGADSSFTVTGSDAGANDGGVLYLSSGTLFELTGADDDARFRFSHNTATNGGALAAVGSSTFGMLGGGAFEYNTAQDFGGAIHQNNSMAGGQVNLSGVSFTENEAWRGGAIYTAAGVLSVADSVFTGNTATTTTVGDDNAAQGGAVFLTGTIADTRATFTNTAFIGNQAVANGANGYAQGGAVFIGGGDVVFAGPTLFEGNQTVAEEGQGGAIHYGIAAGNTGSLRFDGVTTFRNNEASGRGGAIYTEGFLPLNDSGPLVFEGNKAGDAGGGIAVVNALGAAQLILGDDATFTGNRAGNTGGAIVVESSSLAVAGAGDYATFTGSRAGNAGGAVFVESSSSIAVAYMGDYTTFTGNAAGHTGFGFGGALHVLGAMSSSIGLGYNAYLSGNRAGGDDFGRGGAIYTDGDLYLVGNTLVANNAVTATSSANESHGGAIYLWGSAMTSTATLNADTGPIAFTGNKVGVTVTNATLNTWTGGSANSIHMEQRVSLHLTGTSGMYFDDPISSGDAGGNSLIKSGDGFVQFVGDNRMTTAGFAGANSVDVQAGTFRLVDDATFDAAGAGNFRLASDATLAGQGTITAEGFVLSGVMAPDADRFAIPTFRAFGDPGTTAENYNYFLDDKSTTVSAAKSIGTLTLVGDVLFSDATLAVDATATANDRLIVVGNAAIEAGKSLSTGIGPTTVLVADTFNFNNTGTLNLTGYTSGDLFPAGPFAVIHTTDGVANFNPAITVLDQSTVDFLSVRAFLGADHHDVMVETTLTWYSTDPDRPAHGDFTIDGLGKDFVFGVALSDNDDPTNWRFDWDGKSLTKLGTGTLILTGDNTYTGDTTVAGGTLQIGNGGQTGGIAGDLVIQENANVTFNRGDDVTFGGDISGDGSLTKGGQSTLTLTGVNHYTGGTTVNGGTLAGNTTSLQGDILNNAHVLFTQSDNGTYGGTMSGMGSLTKTGAGTLTLTNANTFTGSLNLPEGTLALTGDGTLEAGSLTMGANTTFDYSNADAYGALSPRALKNLTINGLNTRIVHGNGGAADFMNAYLTFNIPSSAVGGDTLLTVTGSADMTGATVSLATPSGRPAIGVGEKLILVDVTGDLTSDITTCTVKTPSGDTYTVKVSDDQLYAILDTVSPTGPAYHRLKAYAEARTANLAFLNQGFENLLHHGFGTARIVTAGKGFRVNSFGAIGGGWSRYHTGSHVDVSGVSVLLGVAVGTDVHGRDSAPRDGDSPVGRATGGAFFETGWGSYNSFNSFRDLARVRGSGEMSYYGGGLLGRYDVKDVMLAGTYFDTSIRAGWTTTNFHTGDIQYNGWRAGFDTSAVYVGGHGGIGRLWTLPGLNGKGTLDTSARVLWTHLDSDSMTVHDDRVRFDSADSLRARLGGRFAYAVTEYASPYLGAYWEHEFAGTQRATANGVRLSSPTLRGSTGIAEVGVTITPSKKLPLSIDLGVQGSAGKREGITGSLQIRWTF